jgi:hypothetical protein
MDERQFDDLARLIATKPSRRQILKVIAGSVGGMFLTGIATVDPANAGHGARCAKESKPCANNCLPFFPCPQCCPGLTCAGDPSLGTICQCMSNVHCKPAGGGQAGCCPNIDPNNPCMQLNPLNPCASSGGCQFVPVSSVPCPGGICQNGECVPAECGALLGQPCGTRPSGSTCLNYDATIGATSEGYLVRCVCTQGFEFPEQYGPCLPPFDCTYKGPGWHCYTNTSGHWCAPDCDTSP